MKDKRKKLTDKQVEEIREAGEDRRIIRENLKSYTDKALAKEYGVDESHIARILAHTSRRVGL